VSTRTADPSTLEVYGVFSVAAARVALALAELREVIPRPAALEVLPAASPAVLGAVTLRHQVIPVLDLGRAFSLGDGREPDVIVIVKHDGYLFGLLANGVSGVARIPREKLSPLGLAGTDRPLFSHTYEQAGADPGVVSVLDSAAVRDLPGVPMVREAGGEVATDTGLGERRTLMLLRCGDIGLCLDVRHVHSVVPELTIKSSALDGGYVCGVVHLGNREVPVLDPLTLLGLGTLNIDTALRGVALPCERGLLVLAASDIVSIDAVPVETVLPLPPFGVPSAGFVDGVLAGQENGPYLLVDGDAVRGDQELDALAGLGIPVNYEAPAPGTATAEPGDESTDTTGADTTGAGPDGEKSPERGKIIPSVRRFLTYQAGVEIATPLAQITEIVPYPTEIIPFPGAVSGVIGIFTHRSGAVPLICLTTLIGRYEEVDPATARVLLIKTRGTHVGFIVPALRAIEESVWEQPANDETRLESLLSDCPLVEVGGDGPSRMLPSLDLLALAEVVSAPADAWTPDSETMDAWTPDGETTDSGITDGGSGDYVA
jgi:purine-binding chemotaxis protein CheW